MKPTTLVTGASSGIGLALASQLADEGHTVLALDRVPCPVADTKAVACDLYEVEEAIERLEAHAVDITGIANVAGVPGTAPPDVVLAVNLVAHRRITEWLLGQAASPVAVVSVASLAAHRSQLSGTKLVELRQLDNAEAVRDWLDANQLEGAAAYDASKRALLDWTTELAAGLAGSGSRANTVSPGPVETPILGDFRTSMGAQSFDVAQQRLGRHATPDEIAAAAAFLLSPAASWINGVDLVADGGLMATRRAAATTTAR